jgi:predicted nucleotidyltransferase
MRLRRARRRPPSPEELRADPVVRRVKAAVLELVPDAEIILYGSRVRGDVHDESDWDFLALTDHEVDFDFERRVWHRVYDEELELGLSLDVHVRNRHVWETMVAADLSPYHQNVRTEGIPV